MRWRVIVSHVDVARGAQPDHRTLPLRSDFAAMKKQFAEVDAAKVKAGMRVKKNHIREGKAGAWRKQFTPEQEAMLMAHHTKQCETLGLPLDLFDVDY